MSIILARRKEIQEAIELGMMERQIEVYVSSGLFPDSADALNSIQHEAKAKGGQRKGAIYVTYSSEQSNNKVSAVYSNYNLYFTVFIFSDNKETDEYIIRLHEACRDILYKTKMFLYGGEMAPIKNQKTGYYMSYIQCGTKNIYAGDSCNATDLY